MSESPPPPGPPIYPTSEPAAADRAEAPVTNPNPNANQDQNPKRRGRVVLLALLVVVVLAGVAVGAVLLLSKGDGTKRVAHPLEVRRLVATFPCTPERPGTPENLQLTAGQEVVRVPRAGCAVVGEVVGSVDRLTKVETQKGDPDCTVTITAPKEYGQAVDAAANVADGQARALVAGGWLLDVRAVIDYPGRPSAALRVVFTAPDQAACDAVSSALQTS